MWRELGARDKQVCARLARPAASRRRSRGALAVMVELTAKSSDELLRAVSGIDISVAPRRERRTSEQRERWSICRFLAAIAESDWIKYPVKLGKRERPDYLLTDESSLTGIEITEAVPPDWVRVDVARNELGERMVMLQRFRPGEPRRSRDEIDRMASGSARSEGWAGDSPEREWATAMLHTFGRKIEVAAKPGFQLFDRNWVLIYDNWPLPGVDDSKAAAHATRQLGSTSLAPFDAFFVETEKEIWCFNADGSRSLPIPELW